MKQIPENKAREERIADEVTVDAYGSEEVMVGWLTYLQDNLACPFEAECIEERKSPRCAKAKKSPPSNS